MWTVIAWIIFGALCGYSVVIIYALGHSHGFDAGFNAGYNASENGIWMKDPP